MNPENRLQSFSPDKRVYCVYTNSELQFDFYDRISYEIKILNLAGKAGTLTAEGWIDNIYFESVSTEQINSIWLLYNSNPQFTAITIDGYPLQVLYLNDNNIYKVTISN